MCKVQPLIIIVPLRTLSIPPAAHSTLLVTLREPADTHSISLIMPPTTD